MRDARRVMHCPTILTLRAARPAPHKKGHNEQRSIDHNGREAVQRVEADRASRGVVHGFRQKVVQVHQHGRDHDERSILPPTAMEQGGNKQWDKEVQRDVEQDRWEFLEWVEGFTAAWILC